MIGQDDEGRYNDHPAYAEGWRDACDGEPLFPDAAVEYAAGWRGWYEAKAALDLIRATCYQAYPDVKGAKSRRP